jgi:hypothetical protein
MTQLQEQQPQVAAPIKVKTRRRANSVAFACRTDYGLPDDDDDDNAGVLPKPLFLVAEPPEQRRRSATEVIEGAKERVGGIFTLS